MNWKNGDKVRLTKLSGSNDHISPDKRLNNKTLTVSITGTPSMASITTTNPSGQEYDWAWWFTPETEDVWTISDCKYKATKL